MKSVIDVLAVWVMAQLIVLGMLGGSILNDRVNCIPPKTVQAYDDSLAYPIIGILIPLVFFAQDTDTDGYVVGCPVTATSTPSK